MVRLGSLESLRIISVYYGRFPSNGVCCFGAYPIPTPLLIVRLDCMMAPPRLLPKCLSGFTPTRPSYLPASRRTPHNTSRRFALGASDVSLVGENPTCSVLALQGCEGLWSYDYGHAYDNEHTPPHPQLLEMPKVLLVEVLLWPHYVAPSCLL